jgi:hypothetical protein
MNRDLINRATNVGATIMAVAVFGGSIGLISKEIVGYIVGGGSILTAVLTGQPISAKEIKDKTSI